MWESVDQSNTLKPLYTEIVVAAGAITNANPFPVNVVSGSTGNAAAGNTGSAVPTQADYGGLNISGTLRGQTGVNPSGAVYASQTDISSIGGTTFALGQAVMASSIPVVFASNQSALPVTGTITAVTAITNALPAGTNNLGLIEVTDGTNIVNVLKSDGTAAGQNAILSSGAYKEVTGLTAGSLNADLFPSTDMSGYKTFSIHIGTNAYSGTLTFQCSNDNTNWVSMNMQQPGFSNTVSSTSSSTNTLFFVNIATRYIRVRMTSYTSGSASAIAEMYTYAVSNTTVNNNQNGTSIIQGGKTNNNAVPGATNVGVLSSIANASTQTWTEGDQVLNSVDLSGNQRTIILGGLMPTGTSLNTYSLHSTSNATTTPTASLSYISSIAISAEVTGTTSTVTIQDKSGTPLKLVNGFSTTTLTTTPTTVNFQTPVKMVGGIDIITAGAVAATIDVWINYYQ